MIEVIFFCHGCEWFRVFLLTPEQNPMDYQKMVSSEWTQHNVDNPHNGYLDFEMRDTRVSTEIGEI